MANVGMQLEDTRQIDTNPEANTANYFEIKFGIDPEVDPESYPEVQVEADWEINIETHAECHFDANPET